MDDDAEHQAEAERMSRDLTRASAQLEEVANILDSGRARSLASYATKVAGGLVAGEYHLGEGMGALEDANAMLRRWHTIKSTMRHHVETEP